LVVATVPPGFEDQTRHKIALRLLPFLFILYIVNYVDRTNLGFAAIGMARDLGFSDRVFGLGAGIFFAREALRSVPVLVLAAAYFMNNPAAYVFMFWFPTMLKRMAGVSDLRLGLLGAVPFAACFVAMQVNGWHSDRQRERKWHAGVPLLIAVCGWIGLALGPQSLGTAMVLFTMVALGTASISVFFSMPTEILSQAAAATAVGIISTMGNISSFLSPYLFAYLKTRTGSFTAALWAVAVVALTGAILTLSVPTRRESNLG